MNNQNNQLAALAERSDIHKSCKSLETLLNILNDYCEAATAIVTLQKKLAKALRDTAGSKVTNEIAANALNASANIFEALAEVDGKFIKIADKEYDAISTEVKRWFKRLTKEEKAHDERIANANARIKQAGLMFEKKSKKKGVDAHEEHSRYIQLISTLGPEITQEKYNHSLQAAQGHIMTILSVAACLSRIADTEWVRTCENVRRFAPTIGPLGGWRSLCEGGWAKDVPGDLVNLDGKTEDNLKLNTIQEERVELEEEDQDKKQYPQVRQYPQQPQQDRLQAYDNTTPTTYRHTSDGAPTNPESPYDYQHQLFNPPRSDREGTASTSASYPSQPQSSSGNSPTLQRRPLNPAYDNTASLPPSAPPAQAQASPQTSQQVPPPNRSSENLHPPSPPFQHTKSRDKSPASDDRERLFSDPVTGSIRSLSAFPAPPTHFPLPPPRPKDSPNQPPVKEIREERTYAAKHRLSESPLPMENNEQTRGDIRTRAGPEGRGMSSDVGAGVDDPRLGRQRSNSALDIPHHSPVPGSPNPNAISAPIPTTPTRLPEVSLRMAEEGEFHAREFGMLREERSAASKARTFNGGDAALEGNTDFPPTSTPMQRRGLVERTDTGGTAASGSIVAAMRNRYSNAPGSHSPPPRSDLPRLHTSVTEIANRYEASPPPSSALRTSTGSIDNSEPRASQSPRIAQSLLRPMSKSPPPGMARHISLPPTPEKSEPRQHGGMSSSSLTPIASPRPLSSGKGRDFSDGAEDRIHRRRAEELAESEFNIKERELREREQEIVMRERELERDRARLLALRDGLAPPSSSASAAGSDGGSYGHGNMAGIGSRDRGSLDLASSQGSPQLQPRPRERRISWRRSRHDSQPQTPQMRQEQLQPPSRSPLQGLIPSSSSPNLREQPQPRHSYSSPPPPSSPNNPDFSTSSTSESNNSYLSRSTGSPVSQDKPQQQQLPEKKGGWMRRLSMPVGNALPFSLDSSKRHANNSSSSVTSSTSAANLSPSSATAIGSRQLGAGIVGGRGVAMPDEKRFRQYKDRDREQGYQPQQQEQDGGRFGGLGLGLARRSYDASRSATNLSLVLGGRK